MSELEHLTDSQREEVVNVLTANLNVFSTSSSDLGCAGITEHQIKLHCDTPIRQRPRRLPCPVTNEIEKQCEELLPIRANA